LSRLTVFSNYDQTNDYDGNLLERELEGGVDLEGPLWSYFNWDIGTRKKVYLGNSFNQVFNQFFFSIRPAGNFSFNTWLSFRDEIDYENIRPGHAFEVEPEASLRLGKRLELGLSHMLSRLSVEGGRLFLANLTQSKLIYHSTVAPSSGRSFNTAMLIKTRLFIIFRLMRTPKSFSPNCFFLTSSIRGQFYS